METQFEANADTKIGSAAIEHLHSNKSVLPKGDRIIIVLILIVLILLVLTLIVLTLIVLTLIVLTLIVLTLIVFKIVILAQQLNFISDKVPLI